MMILEGKARCIRIQLSFIIDLFSLLDGYTFFLANLNYVMFKLVMHNKACSEKSHKVKVGVIIIA